MKKRKPASDERILKFLIWIILRIAVRPVHWKDKRKNKNIIDNAYKRIVSKDFIFIPPAIAFYLIMGFVPTILMALIIISQNQLLYEYIQQHFLQRIDIIQNLDSSSIFNISIGSIISFVLIMITSIWIASAGFAKFVFTLSHIYGHDKLGGYWMNRLRGATIVLCFSIFVSLGLILAAAVPLLLSAIGIRQDHFLYRFLLWAFIICGGFVYLYGGFVALFKLSPRFKLTWRQIHPGSMMATIPTMGFIFLFSIITRYTLNYSSFGAVAPFMTLSMSMLIISYFLYIGILVNVSFYKTHHSKATISKFTISKK